jgi:hypothetical protein
MGVTGPNVFLRPLMELFVELFVEPGAWSLEPGAWSLELFIRTASRRPQRVILVCVVCDACMRE